MNNLLERDVQELLSRYLQKKRITYLSFTDIGGIINFKPDFFILSDLVLTIPWLLNVNEEYITVKFEDFPEKPPLAIIEVKKRIDKKAIGQVNIYKTYIPVVFIVAPIKKNTLQRHFRDHIERSNIGYVFIDLSKPNISTENSIKMSIDDLKEVIAWRVYIDYYIIKNMIDIDLQGLFGNIIKYLNTYQIVSECFIINSNILHKEFSIDNITIDILQYLDILKPIYEESNINYYCVNISLVKKIADDVTMLIDQLRRINHIIRLWFDFGCSISSIAKFIFISAKSILREIGVLSKDDIENIIKKSFKALSRK